MGNAQTHEQRFKSTELASLPGATLSVSGNPLVVRGLFGLKNLGNTCFMNSTLQCLSNTGPLVDFFLDEHWKLQLNVDNVLGHQGQVALAFGKLVFQLWGSPDLLHGNLVSVTRPRLSFNNLWRCCGSISSVSNESNHLGNSNLTVSPKSFKRVLSQHCGMFAGYEQQDSQELLMFLLDALHEDLNRVMTKPYVEDVDYDGFNISYESDEKAKDATGRLPQPMSEVKVAELSWIGHLRRNQSPIVDLMHGQLRSVLQCSTCGHKRVKFEPFMNLELPLPHNEDGVNGAPRYVDHTNIYACLAEFTKVEILCGEHQWRCPKCKMLRDATKQLTLYNLPNVLIITFKRFQVDAFGRSGGKISSFVEFPLTSLDVTSAMSRDNEGKLSIPGNSDDNDPKYDLYGVSNHYGGMGGGHYTAFALNKMDQHWYCFDDSSVRRKGPADICTRNAYVLFFRKQKMQTKLGGKLEESPLKVAPDGTKRKGSVHIMQRQSVKERLEAWSIKQIKSPDLNAKFSINAVESDDSDRFSSERLQESPVSMTKRDNLDLTEDLAQRYPVDDSNSTTVGR
jgi:ubiquitin carboxyl-terminal hydrolase 8